MRSWRRFYWKKSLFLTLIPTSPKVDWFPMCCVPICPHFSDSSTTWLPSYHLFCHTDFLWTDRTFCIAVSFTDMIEKLKRHFQNPNFQVKVQNHHFRPFQAYCHMRQWRSYNFHQIPKVLLFSLRLWANLSHSPPPPRLWKKNGVARRFALLFRSQTC
jgi:hypothetical protein